MKKIVILSIITAIILLSPCGTVTGQNLITSEPKVIIEPIDPDTMPSWKNKIKYDNLEDQLKNLDFTQLNNDKNKSVLIESKNLSDR